MHHSPNSDSNRRNRGHYTWQRAIAVDQLSDDLPVEVIVGKRIVAIFRHKGRIYALDGMCSHQGGPLAQGKVEGGCVTCPWHGWQYELDTGVQTINRQPLQECFDYRETGGWIELLIGDES